MPQIIIDVHSITATAGHLNTRQGIPVVCLALVSVVSTEHMSLGVNKRVIALTDINVGDELVGTEVDDGHEVDIE